MSLLTPEQNFSAIRYLFFDCQAPSKHRHTHTNTHTRNNNKKRTQPTTQAQQIPPLPPPIYFFSNNPSGCICKQHVSNRWLNWNTDLVHLPLSSFPFPSFPCPSSELCLKTKLAQSVSSLWQDVGVGGWRLETCKCVSCLWQKLLGMQNCVMVKGDDQCGNTVHYNLHAISCLSKPMSCDMAKNSNNKLVKNVVFCPNMAATC